MEKPELSPSFFDELASENPLGMRLSISDARAWWDYIAWPRYKTYNYRNHRRAIRRWWSRITVHDIERARAALARRVAEREQEIQQSLLQEGPLAPDPRVAAAIGNIMGARK